MTAISMLRNEAKKHKADSEIGRLLGWAEIHIGDQFDRICELEEEIALLEQDKTMRVTALTETRHTLGVVCNYILKENFDLPLETFARDFAPWQNVLNANGLKPDGTVPKPKRTKKAA
jgi:hypothetical protein